MPLVRMGIIGSTKEVIFLLLCLFVCLYVSLLATLLKKENGKYNNLLYLQN